MLINDIDNKDYDGCCCDNCHFGNIPQMEEWCMFAGGVFHKVYEPEKYCCHRWRPDQTDHQADKE